MPSEQFKQRSRHLVRALLHDAMVATGYLGEGRTRDVVRKSTKVCLPRAVSILPRNSSSSCSSTQPSARVFSIAVRITRSEGRCT